MTERIEAQLTNMVEAILLNIGRANEIQNLDILLEHQFYFDVSSFIFPQFNIQIIKIQADEVLTPEQKIQSLIQLLGKKLEIDVSRLTGAQILKGHFYHMYKILSILHQFSQTQTDDNNLYNMRKIQRHQSEPSLPRIDGKYQKTFSAKFSPHIRNFENSITSQNQQNAFKQKVISEKNYSNHSALDIVLTVSNIPQSEYELTNKNNDEKYENSAEIVKNSDIVLQTIQQLGKKKKLIKKDDKKKEKKLGREVTNILVKEKRKSSKPQKKSIRKNQNEQIKLANKKFKTYLQNSMNKNRQNKKRTQSQSQIRPKSANKKTLYKELEQIDNFFKSFSYRLRDQKQKYLHRMQSIIRTEENHRMWTNQKRLKQQMKDMEKKQKLSIKRLNQCHSIRKDIIQEEVQNTKQTLAIRKKQGQKKYREKEREHREKKKKEMNQIKNYIEQMNNKALMKLEEGGDFQKMVLNMYKRY